MEPTLRSAQVLKEEAEYIGLTGKEVAKYVTEQQTLDSEDRTAWRDTQKRHAEDKKMQAHAEKGLSRSRGKEQSR